MSQVCSGIQYLHECGIAHRDIKCENVLLTSVDYNTASCKLCDFGLSKACGEDGGISFPTAGVGTVAYMAPELLSSMRDTDDELEING